jgi:phosphatidylserine/phosphatidylglycerophosphate/cardiolipin synthase-like enzyme
MVQEKEIALAVYVLPDWPIMQALRRAAHRSVEVRMYLDGTQLAARMLELELARNGLHPAQQAGLVAAVDGVV